MKSTELIEILETKGLEGFLDNGELTEVITSILRNHLELISMVEQRKEKISERVQRCPENLLEAIRTLPIDIIVKKNDDNDFLVPGFYAVNCPNTKMFARGKIFDVLKNINPAFIEHQFMFGRNTRVKVFKDNFKEIATKHLLKQNVLIVDKDLNYTLYTFDKIVEAHENSGEGLRVRNL